MSTNENARWHNNRSQSQSHLGLTDLLLNVLILLRLRHDPARMLNQTTAATQDLEGQPLRCEVLFFKVSAGRTPLQEEC